MEADLDHVLASVGLRVVTSGGAEVAVRGWAGLEGAAREAWVAGVSDHCSVCVEVEVG